MSCRNVLNSICVLTTLVLSLTTPAFSQQSQNLSPGAVSILNTIATIATSSGWVTLGQSGQVVGCSTAELQQLLQDVRTAIVAARAQVIRLRGVGSGAAADSLRSRQNLNRYLGHELTDLDGEPFGPWPPVVVSPADAALARLRALGYGPMTTIERIREARRLEQVASDAESAATQLEAFINAHC